MTERDFAPISYLAMRVRQPEESPCALPELVALARQRSYSSPGAGSQTHW
jgi:hypothetical protein